MNRFIILTQSDISSLVNLRDGETKIGEEVQTFSSLSEICASNVEFVLLGIPEDIGVRANYGIGGASTAWKPALKAFLNIQSNAFLSGKNIAIAGYFQIDPRQDLSILQLRERVAEIDHLVAPVIEKLVKAGKIPIVIGGGHNNAYPIIKGTSLALETAINTINIDAHADLRPVIEGRHSGNPFNTSLEQGYLENYGIYGLHENYNNQTTLDTIATNKNIHAVYFDMLMREGNNLDSWQNLIKGISSPCGLEIDLDSTEGVLSSAGTPTGLTLTDVRKMIGTAKKKFQYLHICEGAQKMENGREDPQTGKTIAYLVSDFIKSQNNLI